VDKSVVNSTSTDKQVESFQNEQTFDFASAVGTESSLGVCVYIVESVADKVQVRFSGTSSWKVLDFPWDTTVITSSGFEVHHAAIITIVQFLAKVIDSVDWFTVASAVVFFKVAPASVLVEFVKVVTGEDIRDSSWLWLVGLDQRSDVSVGEFVHLVFHGLEPGLGESSEESGGGDLQLHLY